MTYHQTAQGVGKDNISIQDFVQNKADLVAGLDAGTSDQIQVWDGSKFTIYFYRANSQRPLFTLGPCWVKNGATTMGTPTTDTIPAGKGFWYARPSTASAGTLVGKSPIAPAAAE